MNWILYVYISLIIMMISLVYFIIKDREILSLETLIEDITEATIISVGWIINIPLLVISNIIISVLYIIFNNQDKGEE